MTDYVSSTQLQEPHIIKEQEVTGKVIQLTLVGSAQQESWPAEKAEGSKPLNILALKRADLLL